MSRLLYELIEDTACSTPEAQAVSHKGEHYSYGGLSSLVRRAASGLLELGLARQERVAVYLPKQIETVAGMFAAVRAGAVFVPVNPLLKPDQVAHILRDCAVRVLITSSVRARQLAAVVRECPDLRSLILTDAEQADEAMPAALTIQSWDSLLEGGRSLAAHRVIDVDMAAILYTSGSTGKPKGVVLSHRNLVTGAESVAEYLENRDSDRILAVLPFSFDYGFNQLTTAFLRGACAILMDYLLPRDVIRAVERERISGLAGVPPLWTQLAQLAWPAAAVNGLRYITNSGGAMPVAILQRLRAALPATRVYLMYGLTEAFRSTYLPPSELDARPESMGKAIPNAEILVVREDGSPCAPDEPGELVHRGSLVALGYWNDADKTAARFRPAPGPCEGLTLPEIAVWSGDTVRMDAEGFLYFIGRRDDMIKTSGYRVSPSEVEEVIYASGLVREATAIGVPHPSLGQGIVAVVTPKEPGQQSVDALRAECKDKLANFMVPAEFVWRDSLPRNPNGKIDRKKLAFELQDLFQGQDA